MHCEALEVAKTAQTYLDTFKEPPEELIEVIKQNLDNHSLYPRMLSSFARHIYPAPVSIPLLELLLASPHTPSLRGKWWEHLTQVKPLLNLIYEAIADPWTRGPQLMKIRRRLLRKFPDVEIPGHIRARMVDRTLNTWNSVTIWANKVPDGLTGYKSRWVPDPVEVQAGDEDAIDGSQPDVHFPMLTVEQVAISHYTTSGYKGMHLENTLIKHIFTLLFFDIIFFVAPDFTTEFMTAPNDFGTPEFFERRTDEIRARVEEIRGWSQPHFGDCLIEMDENLRPEQPRALGLNWSLPHSVLREVVYHLPCAGTAIVCESLALNWGEWQGGLPDLVIWNSNELRLVEVKGPGDSLSDKQRCWMDLLVSCGWKCEVCHVKEEGKGRGGKRKSYQEKEVG